MTASSAPHHQRIVVGVDGSPISKLALRWAITQARLTGATIDAVIAWQYPEAMTGNAWVVNLVDDEPGFGDMAEQELTEAISETAGPDPDVVINPVVVEGWPAEVLLDAAEGADLLVIGSRGRGGFTSALLGSVSQNCAHHATCPLLIIRARKDHHSARLEDPAGAEGTT
jgi:nucleotide-binding universal stress UspA family protein